MHIFLVDGRTNEGILWGPRGPENFSFYVWHFTDFFLCPPRFANLKMIFTFLLTTQSFWNKRILISGSSIKTRTIQNHQKSQTRKVYFCRHSHFETHEVLTVCMTEILLMAVCQGNVNDNNISSLLLTSQNLAFNLISSWIWQFLKISNHNQSHSCYSCFGMSKVVLDSKCVK